MSVIINVNKPTTTQTAVVSPTLYKQTIDILANAEEVIASFESSELSLGSSQLLTVQLGTGRQSVLTFTNGRVTNINTSEV